MSILNIAHRGYSGKFDENTIEAFEAAINVGADGIETDVHLSKDNEPIIIHDEKLNRTTDGKGYVKDYTLEEIKSFKTKSGFKIPSLDEVLILFKKCDMSILNIEIKTDVIDYHGIEDVVLSLIEKYDLGDRVIVSSFNHDTLRKVKKLNSKIKTAALIFEKINNLADYLEDLGCEYYHPDFKLIKCKEEIGELRARSILVNPYTINNKASMRKVIKMGVNGIITNHPEKLISLEK